MKSATNPTSGATGDRGGPRYPGGSPRRKNRNPLKGYRPWVEGTAPSGEQVLVELQRRPGDCCGSGGLPEETAAFGQWLVASARAAANAAKEGGFMGFGAAQVSEGGEEMLDQVARRSHRLSRARSQVDPARGAHRQLSASAVGSTHRIVRRSEEDRLPSDGVSLGRLV